MAQFQVPLSFLVVSLGYITKLSVARFVHHWTHLDSPWFLVSKTSTFASFSYHISSPRLLPSLFPSFHSPPSIHRFVFPRAFERTRSLLPPGLAIVHTCPADQYLGPDNKMNPMAKFPCARPGYDNHGRYSCGNCRLISVSLKSILVTR